MAFVDTGLVVFGPETAVRAALVNKRTGQNLTTNAELMGRIATLSGSANAWAIGRMDAITQRASIPQEVAAKLPALTWFEAVGHVNGGIDGTLRAEARDEESARNMRDMLNGFMAFGRLQAQNNPQVQALMQTMQLGGTGKQVELTFRLPGEVLELIAPKPPAPVAVN
jgi:hypothetical protein